MNLELIAMRWLWLEKKCHYIMEQRSPRAWPCGQPDVLGITKNRFLIEVETKRSLSDFRADAGKPSRRKRDLYPEDFPKLFYYMVPDNLVEKVLPELPEWAGLLCNTRLDDGRNGNRVKIIRESPVNYKSTRLTVKECIACCRYMVNHMMTTKIQMDTWYQINKLRNSVLPLQVE